MSLSLPTATASIAVLRAVGWVHDHHRLTAHLRTVLDALSHQRVGPSVQAATKCSAAAVLLRLLLELQVFEHKDSVLARKLREFSRHHLTRRTRAIALLLPQPFERTAHTACALALCLSGSEFALQSGSRLSCFLGLFSLFSPRQEKHPVVGIHRHNRIGFVEVHADWMEGVGFLDFERDTDLTKHLAVTLDDVDGVHQLGSLGEPVVTRRFSIANLLSAIGRGDAEASVL